MGAGGAWKSGAECTTGAGIVGWVDGVEGGGPNGAVGQTGTYIGRG